MMKSAPRLLADLLVEAMPQLSGPLAERDLVRGWSTAVGRELARRSRPQRLVDGRLTVAVDNSPWLHELTLRREEVTARVRAAFPAVRELRFAIAGPTHDDGPPRRAPRRLSPAPLSDVDRAEIDEAAATIADAGVAAAARRAMLRARRFPRERGAAR